MPLSCRRSRHFGYRFSSAFNRKGAAVARSGSRPPSRQGPKITATEAASLNGTYNRQRGAPSACRATSYTGETARHDGRTGELARACTVDWPRAALQAQCHPAVATGERGTLCRCSSMSWLSIGVRMIVLIDERDNVLRCVCPQHVAHHLALRAFVRTAPILHRFSSTPKQNGCAPSQGHAGSCQSRDETSRC
jgi:hypothetical protein